jgi:hypothetical protein
VILRFLGLTLALAIGAVPLLGAVDLRPELVVVVYPLTATTGTNPEAGSNVAILFSTRMAEGGGLTIKPPTPGTARADFLEAARKQRADYYITGYLTPLGEDISMLAQVVSTFSGTVVFSTTTVVRTYAEAGGQADVLRDAILRHAGRDQGSADQPAPPSSTPASGPSEGPHEGTLANITNLFHHTKKESAATPAPSTTPAPSVLLASPSPTAQPPPSASTALPSASRVVATSAPSPVATPLPSPARVAALPHAGALVLAVAGGEQSDEAHVADALVSSLKRRGVNAVRSGSAIAANPPDTSAQLCAGVSGVTMLYAATLSIDHNGADGVDSVQLDVVGYDCSGKAVAHGNGDAPLNGKGGLPSALDRVADTAAAALTRRSHAAAPTVPAGRPATT